jgi:ABC-type nitrate/sulfonate/bicarbonate transport system substrate-binding protein
MATLVQQIRATLGVTLIAAGMVGSSMALAAPTELRIGDGTAAEEQLWLMQAKPSVTPLQGQAYSLDVTRFPGTDKRFQAFEAGALDLGTASSNAAMLAASEGATFKVVASLSRESTKGFDTTYMVMNGSPIKSAKDLKGKKIGVNALNSSAHLWARLIVQGAGLNPDRDVTFVPIGFPAQGEALRSGLIDVGVFPQPFFAAEEAQGGVRPVFTSKDAIPFDEELMLVIASPDALKNKAPAVRAYLKDLVAATDYYNANSDAARKALIDAHQVRIAPAVYLPMHDYYRDPSATVDKQALSKMQDILIKNGFQRNRIDVDKLVDTSYLPGK